MDFRTLTLGLGVFFATFVVGWWLNIGGLASNLRFAHPADAAAPAGSAIPGSAGASQPKAWNGPGLATGKLTRDAVIAWSQSYQQPACNQDVRWGYTRSASEYAEALMRAAGCNNFPKCPLSTARLEQVWQATRSAADRPVALAMADAHAAGGLNERSFRGDVGQVVRVIAGREFDPGPAPECSSGRRRTSGFRFRVRR